MLVRRIGGQVASVGGCCSEAGTLALSRPDIACAMLKRKRDYLQTQASTDSGQQHTVVTNCPSCISGLGRNRELGYTPQHLAVLLAETIGGDGWATEFHELVQQAELVTF